MDNFTCIYKILRFIEKSMDYQEIDFAPISHEALGVSYERWGKYIEMMGDSGYIKDVDISHYADGSTLIDISNAQITLKGLEYLSENSIMQRLYKVAKGIKEATPFT